MLTPNHHPVNRDGLVLWMAYMNTGSVSALGTVKDYSGNGNDGTCVADAYVDNQGMNFDGTGDYITLSSTSISLVDEDFTFMAWFRTTGSGQTSIISNYFGGSAFVWLGKSSGNNAFWQTRDSSDQLITLTSSTTINDDNWHFIVGVRDTTNNICQLYLDGEFETSSVDNRTGNFGSSTYLAGSGNYTSFWNGKIDDVQIYNRALSAGEIKLNYERNRR